MAIKKSIVKKVVTSIWIIMGIGAIVLLVAAIKRKDAQHCSGISITIEGVDNNFFVDKKDIANAIALVVGGSVTGKAMTAFDLKKLENTLQKDIWVKTAQLFFDNNNKLVVKVIEREPVARVFTTTGTTFYIDSSLAMLPLSEKFSARLPVFTGFPSDKAVLSQQDSALLKDILTVSVAIQKDSFNMAMIDQVDITSQRIFEMVPKIGNTIIVFGDATNVAAKFYKLQLFYKEVMVKTGWNKYSEINVQYTGQVVAKRKGVEDKSTDSLRTLQLMQAIAENTERLSNDSLHMIATDNENNTTNIDLVQQSIQRDDEPGGSAGGKPAPSIVPVVRPAAVTKPPAVLMPKPASVAVKKLVVTKPFGKVARPKPVVVKPAVKPVVKPKAVLPKPVTKPPVKKAGNEY
jgi:cell division protein FtsQ